MKIGLRGKIYDILKNYLKNRKKRVKYKNIYGNNVNVNHGVPQGTILGPLLFLIFINDLFSIKSSAKLIGYADDTTLLYTKKNSEKLIELIKADVPKIFNWFANNGLTVNFKKTNIILFGCYKNSLPLTKYINIQDDVLKINVNL